MGMFDEMKDKAGDLAKEHSDQVNEGLDKAGEFADEKTGGKFGDQIDQGKDMAREQLGNLGGDGDSADNQS
ncbi:antitoxin [Kribbella solani]|uniref:antitoxin n=1 Tax=Kribbella solani TaxID=236067 RepID=UPI0029AD4EB5|nr:antitoxin [Kribbella solani]MDX3005518.1 antitoxin [Kribbella solani]